MRGSALRAAIAVAVVVGALTLAAAASAQVPGLPGLPGLSGGGATLVQPYGTNDGLGFRNVLPPGQNGFVSATDLAQFFATCPPGQLDCPDARRPPHSADQLGMYGDLVYASPGLRAEDVGRYFKDATFGVREGDVDRAYQPRADVTVVRDAGFGVPHVYGRTRAGTMFGLGYVGAEDRLFVMDVLRNAGRGRLSSFAGGSAGNRSMDHEQWQIAPYTEADLQRQFDLGDDVYGPAGKALQDDVTAYVAGVNAYIAEARTNPLRMPAEYAAFGKLQGPEDWKVTDVIATASLVGGIFGKGGGGELDSALLLQNAVKRFGRRRGRAVWRDLRTAEDPEAPVTVHGKKRFRYQAEPRRLRKGSGGMPDRGSVSKANVVASSTAAAASAAGGRAGLGGLLRLPRQGSNGLLVSARESASGRPLAVMGPQTAYFSPQLLMEVDVHGPGIDARGATFAGVGLYVLLGRGRDYAWSATSAGQDITDTFAVPLCEPGGGRPTRASNHYRFRGRCLPIEVLERRNSWTPSAGDDTPAGSEKLRTERTKLGLVIARGTLKKRPVAYTKLRSTYNHEADSALGFVKLNDPSFIKGPRSFQRAVSEIGFTFNWFYADSKNISYYNSGYNPVRARRVSTNFPVHGRFPWQRYNSDLAISRRTPFKAHPRVTNQAFLANWNNKQARGYRAADDNFAYGSIYRSNSLSDRIRRGIRGARKMTLVGLIDAMEDAGTVDLRATKVLPYALRVLGRPRNTELRKAVTKLRALVRAGGHRRDRNHDFAYEHSEAIRILDAWWPHWMEAQFRPTLGPTVFGALKARLRQDDDPNLDGSHLGSAYNGGWYHYAQKDLRRVLKRRLKRGSRLSRVYCGGGKRRNGNRRRCRSKLSQSLGKALGADPKKLYADELCERYGRPSDQWCFDTVSHRPTGAITQQLIHWINRPTFQQVVEIQRAAPR